MGLEPPVTAPVTNQNNVLDDWWELYAEPQNMRSALVLYTLFHAAPMLQEWEDKLNNTLQ